MSLSVISLRDLFDIRPLCHIVTVETSEIKQLQVKYLANHATKATSPRACYGAAMLFRVGGCRWNTVAINLYVYRSDNEIDARGPALAGEAASLNEEPLGHYAAM